MSAYDPPLVGLVEPVPLRALFIGDTIHTALTVTAKEPDPKRPGFGKIVETIRVLAETGLACDHILWRR